ncbi:2-hydroxyacid dehydrogenase [Tianweitania sp. BSSL-BM11]|uniref:2-hydroxyacid dehydrogenase n=1 Tax=Tianweitania aestuarii TaxID=2814886 RepID=A0ABS5S1S2_9HYPH|nr:2-hydroxyacid dehydrogenase [Tianweitania aestuarii]MBS9722476.1 2-hydroxyacid dehydrogenase [Tianweitania aestuarii]
MTNDRPLILVSGKLISHVLTRLADRFDIKEIARPDAELLQPDDRERVRGIAASFLGVPASLIDALPNLEIIASYGVGYDAVDAGHAAEKTVVVTNTPDVLTDEVADTAIALLLNTLRDFNRAERYLRDGSWPDGPFPLSKGTLRNRRVGIFGMGRIGLAIARRLEGFGVAIAYHNRRPVDGVPYTYHATLGDLAAACDTLINVAPATAQTTRAVDAAILQALGEDGVFINVGRGATVDEEALIEALQARTILAAGLDVFANEPHVPQALLDADNAVLLPHVASASQHTRKAMADLLVDNLESWFDRGEALTPVPETAAISRKA